MMLTVKVKVCLVRAKGFWSLIPYRGSGAGRVFQRSTIGVKLGGKGIAGTLVVLEGRRPVFWHDAGGRGGARDRGSGWLRSRGTVCCSSSSASMSSTRESEHIISARETLDSECVPCRHLAGPC